MGELEAVDRLLELFANRPLGEIPQFLRAQVTCAKALVAIARGREAGVEDRLIDTETAFRGLGYPIWLARAQLDRAEWLARQGRRAERHRSPSRRQPDSKLWVRFRCSSGHGHCSRLRLSVRPRTAIGEARNTLPAKHRRPRTAL